MDRCPAPRASMVDWLHGAAALDVRGDPPVA